MPSILVLVGGEEEVTARGLEEGGCRGGVYWLMGRASCDCDTTQGNSRERTPDPGRGQNFLSRLRLQMRPTSDKWTLVKFKTTTSIHQKKELGEEAAYEQEKTLANYTVNRISTQDKQKPKTLNRPTNGTEFSKEAQMSNNSRVKCSMSLASEKH